MSRAAILAAGFLGLSALSSPACAQSTYQLDAKQGWSVKPDSPADPERAVIDQTRRLLAEGDFNKAQDTISNWIDDHEGTDSPYFAEAYLLRGCAKLGQDREYRALFDFEKIARNHTDSVFFAQALEHELEVAILYLNGLRKPSMGMRIDSGVDIAEEIILRIHERLPYSQLDERAEMALADYYYRDRDLKMAATAYDCFLINFPKSSMREHAMQRRAFATIAQFKGPRYDASGLIEAKYQIQQYQDEFPIQAQRTGMGDALTARLDESGAAQMLTVANWYLRHNDPASARLTLARLIRKHPSTASAQEAVALMDKHGWLKTGHEEPKTASTPAADASPTAPPLAPARTPVGVEKGQ